MLKWIGSPSTAPDLELIGQSLTEIAREFEIEVHVVGAEIDPSPDYKVLSFPWSTEAEQILLSTMHIGIMPLADTEFRQRKCGFKIVQYMSAGIPVIASDVGGNRWIMIEEHRVAGYVAKTHEEWVRAFEDLLGNGELRRQRGVDGAEIARERFSLSIAQELWTKSLESVLSIKGHGVTDGE